MIHLSGISTATTVYFPKHFETSDSAVTLTLKNNLTNDEITFSVEDGSGLTDFFVYTADFSELDDGEYTYSITDSENTLSTGLLMIGEFEYDNTQPENNQTYTQYTGF